MKRRTKIILAVVGASVLGIAMIWDPFARVSLEKATVVLPVRASTAPPAGKDDVMAIIYSGDGGWSDLDRSLGTAFNGSGIPVLGVSTFRYYWSNRTLDESAAELDGLMTKYVAQWGKQRVWMIGFSFGANVLPAIVDQLSPGNRARIAQIVLLSPARTYNFEIVLEGYMSKQSWLKEHLKTLMQHINRVPQYDALLPLLGLQGGPPVVCYYGLENTDESLCSEPQLPAWIRVHAKQGGHHFDGGYRPLAAQMLTELPGRAAPAAVTR